MNKSLLPLSLAVSIFLFSACNLSSDSSESSTTSKKETLTVHSSTNSSNFYKKLEYISSDNSFFQTKVTISEGVKYLKILPSEDKELFEVYGDTLRSKEALSSSKKNVYKIKLYIVDSKNKEHIALVTITLKKQEKKVANSQAIDQDDDYIPNSIEQYLHKNIKNPDENNNSIIDGLEGDPFFEKQWYIHSSGVATNPSAVPTIPEQDLNLLPVYHKYMGYNNGKPIIIQIVDSGIDTNHEDLKENIDFNRSLNGDKVGIPTPGGIFKPHGTMLAGIAAARAFNNVGVRGVAPFAKIAGSNWLAVQSLDALDAAWLSGPGANEIAVSNNSWGKYFSDETIYEDILSEGATRLRDGKGRVYVFASGNARKDNADANTQFIINNRYTLVVGALSFENKVASYSTPGANIWTVAYGGADDFNKGPTIATTYLSGESSFTWEEDEKKNYTYAMAGSSAAAPMVSGAVALILEACPSLTYRDVKYIIAQTAKQIDKENKSWIKNNAGLNFSRDYGFGLIDTNKAIALCTNNYTLLPKEESVENSIEEIEENITNTKTISLTLDKNLKIEWVEATIDLDATNASNLDIYITSPSGTKVKLIQSGTKIGEYYIPNPNWMSGGFRFSTGAMLDEESAGEWSIEIVNTESNNSITLHNIELKVYGHKGE